MNETDIKIQKLKVKDENKVVFILGDSPTVTFDENVTVFTYPKASFIETDKTETNKNTYNIETDNTEINKTDTEINKTDTEMNKSNIIKFIQTLKNKFKNNNS